MYFRKKKYQSKTSRYGSIKKIYQPLEESDNFKVAEVSINYDSLGRRYFGLNDLRERIFKIRNSLGRAEDF